MGRSNENEFKQQYEKYKNEVERLSGGLVETSLADFVKMSAFYSTTVFPILEENTKQTDEHIKRMFKIISRR